MLKSILKKYRKFVILTIIVASTVLALFFFFFWYYLLPVDKETKEQIIFEVTQGEGQSQIAQNLVDEGLIRNKHAFIIYIQTEDIYSSLQAGTYELSPSMSAQEIVRAISLGETISEEIQITLPEGLTIKDMDALFVENKLFKEGEFEKAANISYEKAYDIYGYRFLDKLDDIDDQDTLEGFLFPDTYRFYRDSSTEDVIGKMLETFEEKMNDNFNGITNKDDFLDIITIASILQAEVQTDIDMRQVSGIIQNRLENNIALEMDSTVRYVTGSRSSVDIASDIDNNNSPYNTYKHRELPPTPISNTGIQAINAALNPNNHNYLYFITNSNGKAIYAKTKSEHQKNINKYLK